MAMWKLKSPKIIQQDPLTLCSWVQSFQAESQWCSKANPCIGCSNHSPEEKMSFYIAPTSGVNLDGGESIVNNKQKQIHNLSNLTDNIFQILRINCILLGRSFDSFELNSKTFNRQMQSFHSQGNQWTFYSLCHLHWKLLKQLQQNSITKPAESKYNKRQFF